MSAPVQFWVLGAGGLGCPALLGLTAAFPDAAITVVDDDIVDATNLHRQVLYNLEDVGAAKVDAATHRLRQRAPGLQLRGVRHRLEPEDAHETLSKTDPQAIVLECSDQPELKFAVNDAVLALGLRGVIGGVIGAQGQAIAIAPGFACYRCLFHAPPPPDCTQSCAEAGVLGPVAGTLGFAMAHLAASLAAGRDVAGRLFDFDAMGSRIVSLSPPVRSDCRCQTAPAFSKHESQSHHGNRTHPNSAS